MYRKYIAGLLLLNLIILVAAFNITGIKVNHIMSTPAFKLELADTMISENRTSSYGEMGQVASGQRIINYDVVKREWAVDLSDEDYEVLLRIVEAEAGGEDIKGKMLVAGVVLNRVEHEDFPDTVTEVVFQQNNGVTQFSPINGGRYYTVTVSDETVEAVDRVLNGEDISGGALFFAARKHANSNSMRWFDEHLTFLFAHGGHEFFY